MNRSIYIPRTPSIRGIVCVHEVVIAPHPLGWTCVYAACTTREGLAFYTADYDGTSVYQRVETLESAIRIVRGKAGLDLRRGGAR